MDRTNTETLCPTCLMPRAWESATPCPPASPLDGLLARVELLEATVERLAGRLGIAVPSTSGASVAPRTLEAR